MVALDAVLVANIPAILCMVIGFVLVVVEMYVPGFGVPGISGIILLIVGVALKARSAVEALILSGIIVALLLIMLGVCLRSISRGRLSKSKMVLNDVSKTATDEYGYERYLGKTGTVVTTLRPAGIGDFDGERLNVVSDGEFIEDGAHIVVSRVEGNRIVVKPAP